MTTPDDSKPRSLTYNHSPTRCTNEPPKHPKPANPPKGQKP